MHYFCCCLLANKATLARGNTQSKTIPEEVIFDLRIKS